MKGISNDKVKSLPGNSVLVVEVVAGPELHGDAPGDGVLWQSAEDEGAVREQSGPSLLVEVPVSKHRRVGIVASDVSGSLLFGFLERSAESPKKRSVFLLNFRKQRERLLLVQDFKVSILEEG